MRELPLRLAGMVAVSLAAVVAPLGEGEQAALLVALAVGVVAGAVRPRPDDGAGLAMVAAATWAIALGAAGGVAGPVALIGAVAIGYSLLNRNTMLMAVPALGLPLVLATDLRDATVSGPAVVAWAAAVTATLVLSIMVVPAGVDWSVRPGTATGTGAAGPGSDRAWRFRSAGTVVGVALLLAPATLGLARVITRFDLGTGARVNPGDASGPVAASYPGFWGNLDTGEPIEVNEDEILRVRSDLALYLRGAVYDQWDGRRWTSSVPPVAVRWDAEQVDLAGMVAGPEGSGAEPSTVGSSNGTVVRQEIRVLTGGMTTVPLAWRPLRFWSSLRSGRLSADGTLVADEPLAAGATWTVESRVVAATPDQLRADDPVGLAGDDPVIAAYGAEDAVTARVAALARTITADAPTSYDKIQALEAWMADHIRYSRDIERLPEGTDAVDHLLFDSRVGFCEQIGSALVVMARSLGIPARLVVGYVPGRFDTATGEWVSRGVDAHAWAEVYFPATGWQAFDPTAEVPLLTSAASRGVPTWVLGAAAVAGPAVVGFTLALRLRRRRRRQVRHPLDRLADDLDGQGRAAGAAWTPAATVRQRGDRLVAVGVAAEPVAVAVETLEPLWYGPHPDGVGYDEEYRRARAAMDRLAGAVGEVGAAAAPVSPGPADPEAR
ncbi:MAG: transglutaminaseTgpA domain-containing protein [Acidimicrobiales bacterium]